MKYILLFKVVSQLNVYHLFTVKMQMMIMMGIKNDEKKKNNRLQ